MSVVTGAELLEALTSRGMTYSGFIAAVSDERSRGLTGPDRDKARRSAERQAKRWLSQNQRYRELDLKDENRLLVAKVAGLDPADLIPVSPAPLDVRLLSLEAELEVWKELLLEALDLLGLQATPEAGQGSRVRRRTGRGRRDGKQAAG